MRREEGERQVHAGLMENLTVLQADLQGRSRIGMKTELLDRVQYQGKARLRLVHPSCSHMKYVKGMW